MLNTPEEIIQDFIRLQYLPGYSAEIEVLCSTDKIQACFERIQKQWIDVGETEPYASVLCEEKYFRKNLQNNLVEFHDSGRAGIDNLIALSSKNGVPINNGHLFELGCGVGRLTQHFSKHFQQITGWDVSIGNLNECKENLKNSDISNVSYKVVQSLEDFDAVPEWDVFFSEIVIQHNPPPLQYYMLNKILSKIKLGGIFYFQTVTHHDRYNFNVGAYLKQSYKNELEMHLLPMRYIFQAIKNNNLILLDVLKERSGGFGLDSNTFFGTTS